MNLNRPVRSLVLRCDLDGVVREVVKDEFHLPSSPLLDRPFEAALEPSNFAKGLRFLDEVRRKQGVAGWQLLIREPERVCALSFAAALVEGELVVVGSETAAGCRAGLENALGCDLTSLRVPEPVRRSLEQPQALEEQDFNYISELNNELTNAYREIAKKNAELARVNQQKNRLLGAAAHDLRSPLAVIAGYSRMLRRRAGSRLEERERQILEMVESSSAYMNGLIEELVSIAELDDVELRLTFEAVSLASLLEQVSTLNAFVAEQKNITLTFARPPEDLRVQADLGKLMQVLNNLLGNAIKFSPPGSHVQIRLEAHEGEAVVAVADEGPGVAREDQELLFRPYGRTRNKPTGGEPSTGLGLWIARRIVEGHQGRIWIEPRSGGGSVFRFSLPCRVAAEESR